MFWNINSYSVVQVDYILKVPFKFLTSFLELNPKRVLEKEEKRVLQ